MNLLGIDWPLMEDDLRETCLQVSITSVILASRSSCSNHMLYMDQLF